MIKELPKFLDLGGANTIKPLHFVKTHSSIFQNTLTIRVNFQIKQNSKIELLIVHFLGTPMKMQIIGLMMRVQ